MPVSQASVSTVKGKLKFGKASTGAEIKAFFKVWNAVSCNSVQMNKAPFFNSAVRGWLIRA